ncbi:MAG: TAT-variant-translocated molybdopterin oxidoreductase [Planctomycetes bacterium]|nr:TAT-variant-translocated molybdopterin oxidoreductase [Planctomycetota bacterium]MCB9903898.1 TAT-variant-translocated molybdopterin oxidoreductase [Planctomycetota bacterium]
MTNQTTTHWRSLRELENDPDLVEIASREFKDIAPETLEGVDRRRFLQLLGASAALATASGCSWEEEQILSFSSRPEHFIPGATKSFATAMDLFGAAKGLRVTTFDGRPIKVEGNPLHPSSNGATDVHAQAAILEFYDPERSRQVLREGAPSSWDAFHEALSTDFDPGRGDEGAGIAVIARASGSPTEARLRAALLERFPRATWVVYEPAGDENHVRGNELAFGRSLRARYDFRRARRVLALDADFLRDHADCVRHSAELGEGRRPESGAMNRVYAVESRFTSVGATADHRLPLRSSDVPAFVELLEDRLLGERGLRLGAPQPGPHARSLAQNTTLADFVEAAAADLLEHRGESLIVVGKSQAPEVHARVARMLQALGCVDRTVSWLPVAETTHSDSRALRALCARAAAGDVETLLVLGGNPVYDAPADADVASALERAATTVHLGLTVDETARACQWHLPLAHFLESWSDATAFDGTYSVVQPTILPLHGGRNAAQVLAGLLGEEADALGLVRATFEQRFGAAQWNRALHDGLVADSAQKSVVPALRDEVEYRIEELSADTGLELDFYACPKLIDGRYANNGWLQELPDFTTKLTWDNALMVGPATAAELGVEHEEVVELTALGVTLELPVYVAPGQARGSVAVALGYGRTAAGVVGGSTTEAVTSVGVDVRQLRRTAGMWILRGARVRGTGRKYALATTSEHHMIDGAGMEAREARLDRLVPTATAAEFAEHPDFAQHVVHHPPLESLWKEVELPDGHRWGMSIDLSACDGCNACVIACQAENNIPVVGKEQVLKGREMHWIRMDLYYSGDPDAPEAVTQPVACQQCEHAPCEQVCPVAATVHTQEGLNDMVYNRCVGTRYCSNNCPFKVRRFNFFNNTAFLDEPQNELLQLAQNPEVTVRSRGVMEKCTFCVQRIQKTKIAAKNAQRPIEDGEIQSACQQACPPQAIVFGDLADPTSRVAQLHASPRSYALLGELNIRPRNQYLARVTNPNPALVATSVDHGHHSSH